MGTFFKSFWREMGRNTGKRMSNAVFGDKWSTPYRARVNDGGGASGRKSKKGQVDEPSPSSLRYAQDNSIRINYSPYDPAVMKRLMDMFEEYNTENIRLQCDRDRTYEERRREADAKVMAITRLSIPYSYAGLTDMMGKLLTLAGGMNEFGFDRKVRRACMAKYHECYGLLIREYPDSGQVWHYYFINMRRYLSGKSTLIKTLLGLTAFFIFVLAIGSRRQADINLTIILLCISIGIPLLCIICQYIRLQYYKSQNRH